MSDKFNKNRREVEKTIKDYNYTLLEALEDWLVSREIPYVQFHKHFEESFVEKVKRKLQDLSPNYITRKPMFKRKVNKD